MTAAGRGERVERDQYPTPLWCVHRLCEAVSLPWGKQWCEPGAGKGRVIRAVTDYADLYSHERPRWTAFELARTYRRPLEKLGAQVVIGDYIKAMKKLDSWAYAFDFGRCDMFQADQPDLYLLPNRPCFVRVKTLLVNGGERITTSDSSEYAWFLWPEKPQREGRIRVLNETPPEVLRAAKEQAPMIVVDKRRRAA